MTLLVIAVVGLVLGNAIPASAYPVPFPNIEMNKFQKLDHQGFRDAEVDGVWFSTPFGLNCGIWEWGDFGCSGNLAGTPAGTNQIGWFKQGYEANFDDAIHLDSTNQPAFVTGRAQRLLPPKSYVQYRGVQCATMADNSLYCRNSYNHDFWASPTQTWIDDQRQG
ncbi:hypothetical protein [Mycobacteroides sp. CBMA 271]|uniref:hypothetical protein n=1 Tax=Mycobacteroides sp. CBMA 271 TaxID=2606608 RepID=UPI001FB6080D|nr:hypothetical protein [Mycobacteroides sp. CBMA 271]